MEMFKYHVFVCDQRKPEGVPCCGARGGAALIDALRAEVARQALGAMVQVTMCGSLGLCERGPNMVVYPEGTWYSGVRPADVPEIVERHFRSGQVVERLVNRDPAALHAEIGENRARMLATQRHREECGTLPDALHQTIRGFQESRVVLTAIELDVFSAAGTGSTAAEVAATVGADARAMEMLLNALVAMGLLTKEGGTYANTVATRTYLSAGGAHDSRAAMRHTVHLWDTWSRLTESVVTGTAVGGGEHARGDGHFTHAFIAAMHKNAEERAAAVVRSVAAGNSTRMLDIGGGSGAYSIAFADAHPRLRVDLLDLPDVTPIAERHIAAARLTGRVTGATATCGMPRSDGTSTTSSCCPRFVTCSARTRTGTCSGDAGRRRRRVAAW